MSDNIIGWVKFTIIVGLILVIIFQLNSMKSMITDEIEIEEYTNQKLDYLESDINKRNVEEHAE